jgi:hypothetical protein
LKAGQSFSFPVTWDLTAVNSKHMLHDDDDRANYV